MLEPVVEYDDQLSGFSRNASKNSPAAFTFFSLAHKFTKSVAGLGPPNTLVIDIHALSRLLVLTLSVIPRMIIDLERMGNDYLIDLLNLLLIFGYGGRARGEGVHGT